MRQCPWLQVIGFVALLGPDRLLQVLSQTTNYPDVVKRSQWCAVPNYRYYRFTPTKVRGYAPSDTLHCGLQHGKPDGCICTDHSKCLSGYCVLTDTGASYCNSPIVQLSEVEFWRSSQRVNTDVIDEHSHTAFRIMNMADVPRVWGIWELYFYSDTNCTQRIMGGNPIASSSRVRGFGHSVDWTAQNGSHDTARTYWQATQEPPLEHFALHGPVQFAFDGDLTTNWWPTCENPCRAGSEWVGLDFGTPVPGGVKCVMVTQDKDRDYASFSIAVQGLRHGGGWETFATFKAATWNWGGVWEKLSIPQGVAFVHSTSHGRTMDHDQNTSSVDLVGKPIDYDFGVETEIDAWRWATAEEPTENVQRHHDGFTCDRDGLCPRDPVQWTLEGSLDFYNWVMLQKQDTDFPTTTFRKRFVPFQPVLHQVSLGITDIWPDGSSQCAARR